MKKNYRYYLKIVGVYCNVDEFNFKKAVDHISEKFEVRKEEYSFEEKDFIVYWSENDEIGFIRLNP